MKSRAHPRIAQFNPELDLEAAEDGREIIASLG